MRPTDCPRCQQYFTSTLQAEARMELVKSGPSAAQALVDERLEYAHVDHDTEDMDDQVIGEG